MRNLKCHHLLLLNNPNCFGDLASKGGKVIEDRQSARPKLTRDSGLDPAHLIASALRCFVITGLEILQDTAYKDTGDDAGFL